MVMVPSLEDCDDNDPATGSSALDKDCDGIAANIDCDDFTPIDRN